MLPIRQAVNITELSVPFTDLKARVLYQFPKEWRYYKTLKSEMH